MKCQNCGHELIKGAEFCDQCGAKAKETAEEFESVIDASKIQVEGENLLVQVNKKKVLNSLRLVLIYFGIVTGVMFYAGFMLSRVLFMIPEEFPFYITLVLALIIPLVFYTGYRLGISLFQIYFEGYKPAKDWPGESALKIPLENIKEIVVSITKFFWKTTFTQRLHFVEKGKSYYVPIPVRGTVESQENLEDLLEDFKKIVKKDFPLVWKAWGPISSLKYIREYMSS